MTRRRLRFLLVGVAFFLFALCGAQSFRKLHDDIKGVDDRRAISLIQLVLAETDSDLADEVADLSESPEGVKELRLIIAQRATAEQAAKIDRSWATKVRSTKKGNILYRDADKEKQGGNWLAKAYEKLGEAIQRLFNRRGPNVPNIQPPTGQFGPWLVYTMWGLLGRVLVACL